MLLAGPFANFLFAAAAYWVLFIAGIPALKPVLGEIAPQSIAARAGLASGDEIIAVGNQATGTREAVVLAILDQLMNGGSIALQVRSPDGATRYSINSASATARVRHSSTTLGPASRHTERAAVTIRS